MAEPLLIDHPYRIDTRGRTADTVADDHIRDLIFQVLFTSPGERVNRPDFGCGIKQLVFMPNSDALATATKQLVQASLQRWLGELIAIEQVEVEVVDSRLEVELTYSRLDSGERRQDKFSQRIPG